MGFVFVEGRAGELGIGHERRQLAGHPGMSQNFEVEIGERHHRANAELLAQRLKRRDVGRVVDAGDGTAVMGGVLGRSERVGIGGDHGGVLGKGGDDVVALAHPGEHHSGSAGDHGPTRPGSVGSVGSVPASAGVSSGVRHPPPAPL